MAQNIYVKRDTQANLDANTLGLAEPCFTTDTKRFYVGNGVSNILIGGTPGSDTEIPFNDNGVWGTDSDLTFNKSTGTLTVGKLSAIDGGSESTPVIQIGGGDNDNGFFMPATDNIGISTGGTERVRIDASGRVGIGTVPDSGYMLHIKQPVSSNAYGLAETLDTGGSTLAGWLVKHGSGTSGYFYAASGGIAVASITASDLFFLTATTTQMRVLHTPSATRYITATGSVADAPALSTSAGDLHLKIQNTRFGAADYFRISAQSTFTNLSTQGGYPINFYCGGAQQLQVKYIASTTDYLVVHGSSGGGAFIRVGGGANAPLGIASEGLGAITFYGHGTSTTQFKINSIAGTSSWLEVTGSGANTPTMSIGGSGTVMKMQLSNGNQWFTVDSSSGNVNFSLDQAGNRRLAIRHDGGGAYFASCQYRHRHHRA